MIENPKSKILKDKELEAPTTFGFNLNTTEKLDSENYSVSNSKKNLGEFLNQDYSILFLNEKSKNFRFKLVKVDDGEKLSILLKSIDIPNHTKFENDNLVFFKFFKSKKDLFVFI